MGLQEWGNFGSQRVRSVINGAIFNRSASNLVCAHDFGVCPPGEQESFISTRFGPFFGTDPFWGTKITSSHNFLSGYPFYLKFGRFLFGYDILEVVGSYISNFVPKWAYGNGAILGPRKGGR